MQSVICERSNDNAADGYNFACKNWKIAFHAPLTCLISQTDSSALHWNCERSGLAKRGKVAMKGNSVGMYIACFWTRPLQHLSLRKSSANINVHILSVFLVRYMEIPTRARKAVSHQVSNGFVTYTPLPQQHLLSHQQLVSSRNEVFHRPLADRPYTFNRLQSIAPMLCS